jgi:hypothetical protein
MSYGSKLMVLSKAEPGSAHPYIPGSGAWGLLVGTLLLVTFLTFGGTDRAHVAAAFEVEPVSVLKSEIDHAGA